jgi:hypothetical protein
MVQMSAHDKAIVMAIPGNATCMDCGKLNTHHSFTCSHCLLTLFLYSISGMKNPQWASVSFGTVFCLECSGVHRYDFYIAIWRAAPR